jgi:hypothetical protein
MRPILRFQSQLLFRKSYKPVRIYRIRPGDRRLTFRPSTNGGNARTTVKIEFTGRT